VICNLAVKKRIDHGWIHLYCDTVGQLVGCGNSQRAVKSHWPRVRGEKEDLVDGRPAYLPGVGIGVA
jgi:hypothetical protein